MQPATLQGTAAQAPAEGSSGGGAVVLDVRNAYEWDAGHFVGAARPLEVSALSRPGKLARLPWERTALPECSVSPLQPSSNVTQGRDLWQFVKGLSTCLHTFA